MDGCVLRVTIAGKLRIRREIDWIGEAFPAIRLETLWFSGTPFSDNLRLAEDAGIKHKD
jgi:hypothetical protein